MPKSKKKILIAYVPVLHLGYRKLFEKFKNYELFILDKDVLAEFDYIRKDLRQLPAVQVVEAVKAWKILKSVKVLNRPGLKKLTEINAEIIMPDEDIARELNDKYFDSKAKLYPIFLRWDRRNTSEPDAVDPSRTVSTKELDFELMQLASDTGLKSTNLYRRVGALIVKDGEVLLAASNMHQPSQHTPYIEGDPRNTLGRGVGIDVSTDMHAEAALIAEAAKLGIPLSGASMYVATFPCPLCAKYIALTGIEKLYYGIGYAVIDGKRILEDYGIELIQVEGIEENPDHPDVWVPYPEK